MEEKWMVNDILLTYRKLIEEYTKAIIDSKDIVLIKELKKIREEIEDFEYEFFALLNSKLYLN